MSAPREERAGSEEGLPRFFLEVSPVEGAARLAPDEGRHAATVLRLRAGERILGLDGRGRAWPLAIRSVTRSSVEVELAGPEFTEPAPGDPRGGIPELRIAFSMPQANRLEALVDRLTQLGVARIAPFVAAHTPVRSRTLGARGEERLTRIARAACKQSRRLWEPTIEPLRPLAEVLEAARADGAQGALLDPRAPLSLGRWCREQRAAAHDPLTLYVGPEGGFASTELEAFARTEPALPAVWLAPHVLRIETAAELAAGLVLHESHAGRDRRAP